MITVVVTGGRDYQDSPVVNRTLDKLHAAHGIALLVEGGATGADTLARVWARAKGIPCKTVKADWAKLGKAAGPIRNKRMLEQHKPDVVCVFPGGDGTADCVRQALARGIYCWGPGVEQAAKHIKSQGK